MKNVLVTGAAGFLGSHLCLHHLQAGDRVWGVDNFSSSASGSKHYRRLLLDRSFEFTMADICDYGSGWPDWTKGAKFDLIYNFACPASPPRYQSIPVETMLTCVQGTRNVLALAREHGAVLVHASTSEVYGDPDVSPQQESYRGRVNSYGPRACYDEGKRAAEALCYDYLKKHGTDARLVRIFNTYGPHMDPRDGRVVSNLICQALNDQRLTIYGDGSQTRSFCYVDDLIRGIVALGALGANPGGPINLGNPYEFTVSELALLVLDRTDKLGVPLKVPSAELDARFAGLTVRRQLPKDDPMQRRPDISRARELLGWEPRVQLAEGLTKTIEYFKSVLQ